MPLSFFLTYFKSAELEFWIVGSANNELKDTKPGFKSHLS